MPYHSWAPAAPLGNFIDDVWLYRGDRPAHRKERIVPSGTTELVINLRDDEFRIYDRRRPGVCERFSGAMVSGPYRRFFVIDTVEDTAVLGVHFKPGGALPFFGRPLCELVDTHVDLETLWGRSVRGLRDEVRAARTPLETFHVVETELRARLSAPAVRNRAVRFALDALGGPRPTTVGSVCDRVGLSRRRFIEVFKTEVGLTPKRFHRMQRFQRLLALARRNPAPDWSRLGLDCGFFDQSHLIRDFVEFSGFSPADFFRHHEAIRRRGVHLKRHHLPLADEGQIRPIRSPGPTRGWEP
jgi:AraC-like DNA-binding protein